MVDAIGNMYHLMVIGDLNGWIGNRMKAGGIGAFGVDEIIKMTKGLCAFVLRGRCVLQTLSSITDVYMITI